MEVVNNLRRQVHPFFIPVSFKADSGSRTGLGSLHVGIAGLHPAQSCVRKDAVV
jgi:hypothetical protein